MRASRRVEVYVVRFETIDGEMFGGRVKLIVDSFEEIRERIAQRHNLAVESVSIESAVLIERKWL